MTYILAFIFGSSLGSFANVLADRVGVKEILNSRSECLSCGKKLSFRELIPIFSYLLQKGRCKNCKSAIPITLLLSEIISGISVVFVAQMAVNFSINPFLQFLYFLALSAIVCISVAIIIYDIRHMYVPYQFIIPLFIFCFLLSGLMIYNNGFEMYNLLSPFAISVPFLLLFIFSKGKWVGLGDVILYFCFGMILTLPAAVSAFFYSVWIGAFVSIFLIVMYRRDYKFKSEVPFTPFIIIGAFMALYFNPDILYINDLIQIYGNF